MKKRTPTKKPKDVMDQRLNIVTLGVVDIKKARTFYQALGWTASSASKGNIVFFRAGGVVLALYPRELLAEDAQVSAEGSGFRGFTLAQNVRSKRQVAKVLTAAKAAGGKVLKRAQDVFWGGHSGYFSDPDGHIWEVAWNPFFNLSDSGIVELPPRRSRSGADLTISHSKRQVPSGVLVSD